MLDAYSLIITKWTITIIEEEILDQGLKRATLEEEADLWILAAQIAIIVTETSISIETVQWIIFIMWKKQCKNINN